MKYVNLMHQNNATCTRALNILPQRRRKSNHQTLNTEQLIRPSRSLDLMNRADLLLTDWGRGFSVGSKQDDIKPGMDFVVFSWSH